MATDTRKPPEKWSSIEEPVAREILRQGEIFLNAQLTVALAADQRATSLVGILITAATGLFGVAGVFFTASSPRPALAFGFVSAGAVMLTAVLFFVLSLAPTRFKLVGNNPRAWWKPRLLSAPLVVAIGGEGINYQNRIQFNNQVLRRNARHLRTGLWIASASPIVGLGAWALVALT